MAALTPEQLSALTPAYMAEVNPTSHHMYDTAVAFMVLNTLFLGLLITSLVMKGGKIDLEVFFLVPLSYLTVMGNAIIGFLLVTEGGVGRHMAYFLLHDPATIITYLKLQTGIEIIYMGSITFPKLIIVTLYLKIFTDRISRAITWVMGLILVLFFFGGLGLALGLCQPYAFKWDKTINGHCGNILAGYQWVSIPSIITDVFILILPIPTIWRLQMNQYRKAGLTLTFMTGGLGIIFAILRAVTFFKSDLFSDPTFLAGETMSWTIIESSAYFICSCLPRIRYLLKEISDNKKVASAMKSLLGTLSTRSGSRTHVATSATPSRKFSAATNDDNVGFIQMDAMNSKASWSQVSAREPA